MSLKPVRRSLGLILMIDGVRGFLSPVEYPRRLQFGNALWDDIMDYFAENPDLTRKLSVAEAAVGAWLLFR